MQYTDPPKPGLADTLRRSWGPLVLIMIIGGICWWIGNRAAQDYRWQWHRVWAYFGTWTEEGFRAGLLMRGLAMTLKLSACSLAFAVLIGLLVACMRLSTSPPARLVAGLFLGAIRNAPLLMQLFMVHFVVAPVLGLGQFAAAVLALAAFEGSYMAEIFRAGVISMPKAQWEAAISLGMGIPLAARTVILPQAFRRILAPLVNQTVSLIKDTSLVGAIAVADLTMRAREAISETYLSFEIWLVTAVVYMFLTLMVSIPAMLLEDSPSNIQEKI